MPTLGQALGDKFYDVAYGPQYNAYKRKQALDESGYIPNENDGLIDSFQAGLSGSIGGLLGQASGWAKENGYDWLANEAMYGANQMGNIAARNAYTGSVERDGYFGYAANQAASALGSSVPSIAADVAATAAVGAVAGSVVPGAGTAAGGAAGALAGIGRGLHHLYTGYKAVQYGTKAAKIAGGIAVGGLVENTANAGDTYMTGLSRGMSHDEAWGASNQAFTEGWAPAVLNYTADKISLGMPMKGISAAMAVGTGGKVLAKTAGAWATNAMIGATGEGLTEAWQQQIQEQALGNQEYANTRIYDPSTWTDEMKDQAQGAFAGSLLLGGVGGAVNAGRGWIGNKSDTNIENNDIIDTAVNDSEPTTEYTSDTNYDDSSMILSDEVLPDSVAPVANNTNDNFEAFTTLSDETPDQLAPQQRGDFDDVFDTMNARFDKNQYTEDEKVAKQQAVQDTVQRISDLWDNSIDETNTKKLDYDTYMDDFINAGLDKKEAHEASKELVKALNKKSSATENNRLNGARIVERADKVGYELTEAQRADLLSDKPIKKHLKDVDEAVEKMEMAQARQRTEERNRQKAEAHRAEYSSRYNESINKPFVEPMFGDRAEDTSYAISNAIKERNADKKAGRKVQPIKTYLAKQGINDSNYSKRELKEIESHVNSIDKAKTEREWDNTQLSQLSADNANVAKTNRVYNKALNAFDETDPRNREKIKQTKEKIADQLIQLGKAGKPIHRYDVYNRFKKTDKELYNRINESVYGKPKSVTPNTAPKQPQVAVEATAVNPSIEIKSQQETAKETGNNLEQNDIKREDSQLKENINENKPQKTKQEEVKVEPTKNEPKKEVKRRGKAKDYTSEGKSVIGEMLDGKISPKEALKQIADIEKSSTKKHKPSLQRLMNMVRNNTDKDGNLKAYDRSDKGKAKDAQIIIDRIAKLETKINEDNITNKGYEDEVSSINKQIEKFYSNHLDTTESYAFEIPKYNGLTVTQLAKAYDEGRITHPAYVRDAVLTYPSNIDENIFKWLSKELNRPVTKYRDGQRNRFIAGVLSKTYEDSVKSVGTHQEAYKANPELIKKLSYAIAGSFPKQSFGQSGNEVRDSRNQLMFNGNNGLTKTEVKYQEEMLALAKRFFREGLEEKVEAKPVEQKEQKVDRRKDNGKERVYPISVAEIKTTEDPEVFHFTLDIKNNEDFDIFMENIGVDIDSINNRKEDGTKVSFDAELYLGTMPFDEGITSQELLKDESNITAIYKARQQVLKTAISNSDSGSLLMNRENVGGLQKILDKLYGKGKYKVDKVEDGILVHPKEVSIEDALDDAVMYQFGKDEREKPKLPRAKNEQYMVNLFKKLLKYLDGKQLNLLQIKALINSLRNTSKSLEHTLEFMDGASDVLDIIPIKKNDFNGVTDFHSGTIKLTPKAIAGNSSTLVHELTHYAISSLGDYKSMANKNHVGWTVLDNTLKDWREHNEKRRRESETSVSNYQQGSVLDGPRQDNSRNDSGIQTAPQRSNDASVQGRESGRLSELRLLPSDSENSGNRNDSTRENVSGESGLQTASPQSLSGLGDDSSWGIELGINSVRETDAREWLENFRGDTNKFLNGEMGHEDYLLAAKKSFVKIEVNKDMYMTDKANALLSIVDEVKQVDKILGLTNKDSLYYQLMTKDNTDKKAVSKVSPSHQFQEAVAYASHTVMSKDTYSRLMSNATQNFQKHHRNRNKTHKSYQSVVAGSMNEKRLENLLFGDGIEKKSLIVTDVYSTEDGIGIRELDKYKPSTILLKHTFLDSAEYFMHDSDVLSTTDRKAGAVRGRTGRSIEDIIRENKSKLGINPQENRSALGFTALMANEAITKDEAKQNNITNRNMPDTSHAIVEEFIRLAERFGDKKITEGLAKLDKIEDKENYLLGHIDENKKTKQPPHVLKRKDFVGGLFHAIKYMGENQDKSNLARRAADEFGKQSGIKPTKELEKGIERIAYLAKNNYRSMNEIKMVDRVKPEHISSIILDASELNEKQIERYKKRAEELGIHVTVQRENVSREGAVSTAVANRKVGNEVLFQTGKEDTVASKAKNVANKVKNKIQQKDDNIEFEAREAKQGNIAGYSLKKWLRSPVRFIEQHMPQMKPIIYWAKDAEVKSNKLQRHYLKSLDKIKTNLGEENIESFNALSKYITKLGREVVQPASVMFRDKEAYINIKYNDTFREFKDEIDAKKLYDKLKAEGKHAFMDYKDGNFRVFASNEPIKAYSNWEAAHQASLQPRDEILKSMGYNDNVIEAYNAWRKLDDKAFDDSVKAWQASGADPDHKPKRLWGHIPMLHSRYGVFTITESVDADGNVFEQRKKVASFHTYKDAKHYVSTHELNKESRVIITERNSQFDEYVSSDIYEGTNESAYDDIVYEGESREQQEARFARISHSYPSIKKIIDEFIGKKEHVSRVKLMELINDKQKQEDLGVNPKQLEEELKHANLDELFRRRDTITRQDIIGHLLLGYGNLRKDKYNNKRTNAEGANPDIFDNMETYLRYKANFIPKNEFYHKATALYRDVIGTDYASQFGVNGEGARRDVEDVIHNYISSVMGTPNTTDKKLNRTVNEMANTLMGEGWIQRTFGDTAATDLMNRSMEVITVAKLGLFRPTAAIAQLGALLNIATKTGYTPELAHAIRDATMFGPNKNNVSMAEKRMFNNIGLNLEDTAMETQTLKNRQSIYNLKVGNVKLGKLLEKSMDMFNRMDKYTRRVAALHAFRKAIAEGKSQQEAEHIALDFVTQTNFDYSDKDASQLFTKYGTFGKLLLQFKKYPVKELEFLYDIIKSGNKQELGRFLGSYMVMAGLMGIPGMGLADELAEWIRDKSVSSSIKETVMEWAGNDPVKKNMALLAMYGLPAPTIGADFSRNVGVGDLVPTEGFAGVTFGTMGQLFTSIKNHNTANGMILSMLHDLSPAFANYYQAATGHKQDWKRNVQGREYSTGERVLKFLGFRPVLDAVEGDIKQIEYANKNIKKAEKDKVINEYLNDPTSFTKEELKEAGITERTIKNAEKRLGRATKEEKKTKAQKRKERKEKRKKEENRLETFAEDLN